MTDKEKIRAEIERRIEELQPCNTRENLRAHGAIAGYYQILSFINSLQEEPVSIWHDASEKPERDDLLIETNDGRIIHRQSINNYGMVKRWAYTSALLNLDNSCNLGNNSQEEPVSEDLGYYINELSKQFQEVSFAKLSRIAVRVAKWQKEKDFQYIKKECERTTSCCDDNIAIEAQRRHPYYYTSDIEAYANIGFKEGATWQKEQIMKDAVDGKVVARYPKALPSLYDAINVYIENDIKSSKEGDNVKVIIIKEG